MLIRSLILIAALTQLSACYPVFDFKTPEKLTFDAVPPSQAPMAVADLMCCFDCTV